MASQNVEFKVWLDEYLKWICGLLFTYNPDIANTFFRAGHVETWGREFKICESCRTTEYLIRNMRCG